MRRQIIFTAFGLGFLAFVLNGQTVPATINYQGRLTDNTPAQTPVNATVPMQFALYDAASGGTRLWQEPAADNTGTAVAVTNGIFNYVLGSTVAIPPLLFTGATSVRYLQITVNPAASAEILTPRQLITATGYANLAQNANNAISALAATTAFNAVNLGGQSAASYLLTTATAADSAQLGGTAASGWQKALTLTTCPVNQFYTAIAQNGTAGCAAPTGLFETDPKVGTLTTGRVPYWNATSLTNGTLFDSGTKIGINTASPIAPFHLGGANPVLAGSAATGSQPYSVYIQGRYAYVVNYSSGNLQIFDVSNPAVIPAAIGTVAVGATSPSSIQVQGQYAYVTNFTSNSLKVFDISNPALPVVVGTVATGGFSSSVYVQGRYAYVVNEGANSLQVFDISNPASIPAAVGTAATSSAPRSIYVHGRYAYVANFSGNSLQVFNIANPALPVLAGIVLTGTGPSSVFVQGRYAYVVNRGASNLQVFDVANPASIPAAAVGTVTTGTSPNSVYVQGRYAYVVNLTSNSLQVFDVSNPAAIPAAVGTAATGAGPVSVFVQGRFAYAVNNSVDSLQAFDLGGAYIQQLEAGGIETGTLSTRSNAQFNNDVQIKGGLNIGSGGINSAGSVTAAAFAGNLSGNASTATAANALVANGANCTAGNYPQGVDAAGNAENCVAVAASETDPKVGTLTTGWMPVWNNTSLSNGSIYDALGKVGINTTSPIATLHLAGGNPVSLGAGAATGADPQSVFVQGRYAYVVNQGLDSLQVFDISNPATIPAAVGNVNTGVNPSSVYVQGRYAYVVSQASSFLQIFDISNPAAIPAAVGNVATGSSPDSIYVQGRYAYVVNLGASTLQVFDVSNPAAIPAAVGTVATGTNPLSVFVQGRYAYVVNTTVNTLQVFDISNPALPVVAGAVTTAGSPRSVFVQGRYAYVVNYSGSLQIFDISNPSAIPGAAGFVATGTNPNAIQVQGRYAYVVTHGSNLLQVFDISNPAAIPAAVGTATTGGFTNAVHVQGRYAYVVNLTTDNLQSFDLGGAYIQQLEAGGIETGTLTANSNAQFNNDVQIKGGLNIGNGGIYTPGPAGIGGTLSVEGPLSIGVRFVTCAITTPTQSCACAAGETVVSGGAVTTGTSTVRQSRPVGTTIWQVTCTNSAGTDINCSGMNILCDRRAP